MVTTANQDLIRALRDEVTGLNDKVGARARACACARARVHVGAALMRLTMPTYHVPHLTMNLTAATDSM